MPTTFSCTHCTKSFGKHEKLQRHLLTDHHGELRLSPGRAADCEAIGDVLARAVDAANAAFADWPAGSACPCAICGESCKPFRNAMDLAQHLVAKHDGRAGGVDGGGKVADVKKGGAQSEVSASGGGKRERGRGREKGKRNGRESGNNSEKGSVGGELASILGKRKADGEVIGAGKVVEGEAGYVRNTAMKDVQERTDNGIRKNATVEAVKPNKVTGGAERSAVVGGVDKGCEGADFANKTQKTRNTTGGNNGMDGELDGRESEVKKRRMSAAAEMTASGTKPPITPKKKVGENIEWIESHGIRLPRQAAIRATTLNFSYFGGFSAYSHKSYYRLVDR